MSGYVLADVTTVKVPRPYQRYHARGGEVTVLEGSWQPRWLVIVRLRASRRQRHGGTQISTAQPGQCARPRQ